MAVFWVVVPCSLVGDRPDTGGSKYLWNVGKLLPDYTALQPRWHPSSFSPPWEPQILLKTVFPLSSMLGSVISNQYSDALECTVLPPATFLYCESFKLSNTERNFTYRRHLQIACFKVTAKSYNLATWTAEPRRVKTVQNSQRSKASNPPWTDDVRPRGKGGRWSPHMALKHAIWWLLL
jgi:hypothetical protein